MIITTSLKRCIFCGARRRPHKHHVGGRNHVPWITYVLCEKCHENFHARFRQSIELHFTPNNKMRLIRAMQASLVFLWVLLEMLIKEMRLEAN